MLRKNKKGITLIETVVAVLILGMAVGAMLGTIIAGKVSVVNAKHRLKAMNLVMARMEWVKTHDAATIESWGTPIVEDDVDNLIGTDELIDDTRTILPPYRDPNYDNNLVVTITLNWRKQGWGNLIAKGTAAKPDEKLVTLICSK